MFFINIKLRCDYRNTFIVGNHEGGCQNLRHHRIFRHHRHHLFIFHKCSRMRVHNMARMGWHISRCRKRTVTQLQIGNPLLRKRIIKANRPIFAARVRTDRQDRTVPEIDKRLPNSVFFQQLPYFCKRLSFPIPAQIDM